MKGSPGQLVRDLFKVLIHIEPYLAIGASTEADKARIWTYGILCWTGKPSHFCFPRCRPLCGLSHGAGYFSVPPAALWLYEALQKKNLYDKSVACERPNGFLAVGCLCDKGSSSLPLSPPLGLPVCNLDFFFFCRQLHFIIVGTALCKATMPGFAIIGNVLSWHASIWQRLIMNP